MREGVLCLEELTGVNARLGSREIVARLMFAFQIHASIEGLHLERASMMPNLDLDFHAPVRSGTRESDVTGSQTYAIQTRAWTEPRVYSKAAWTNAGVSVDCTTTENVARTNGFQKAVMKTWNQNLQKQLKAYQSAYILCWQVGNGETHVHTSYSRRKKHFKMPKTGVYRTTDILRQYIVKMRCSSFVIKSFVACLTMFGLEEVIDKLKEHGSGQMAPPGTTQIGWRKNQVTTITPRMKTASNFGPMLRLSIMVDRLDGMTSHVVQVMQRAWLLSSAKSVSKWWSGGIWNNNNNKKRCEPFFYRKA